MLDSIAGLALQNAPKLLVTVLVLGVYLLISRVTAPRLYQSADHGGFKEAEGERAARLARLFTAIFCGLTLLIVWGVEVASLLVFAGTALTLLGVALFASWSLLSNVTAYFVLLLHPTFRRGTFLRILDADNYAEGYIADLGLFSVKLITENREAIVYPNNLVLGRPCQINPRDRLLGVGKLPPAPQQTTGDATTNAKSAEK